jgi:hypothetical protein
MATITRFEDIEAWQLGRELKRLVYRFSKTGDFAKDFALKDRYLQRTDIRGRKFAKAPGHA